MLRTLALMFGLGWAGIVTVLADETVPESPVPFVPPSPSNPAEPSTPVVTEEAVGTATVRLEYSNELSTPDEVFAETVVEDGTTSETTTEIQIGTDGDSDLWPKVADFSAARWYPDGGGLTWLPGHRDRFGMFSLRSESAGQFSNWENLSLLSGMSFHFLNGPVSTDLPSKLFDFDLGLHWNGEVTDGWWANLRVTAGVYSDIEDSARDGWRFPSEAIVFTDWSNDAQAVFGVKYFDRRNLVALPVGGVILRPDDQLRLELLFPEPRVAWQVSEDDDGTQRWLSLSGQIGGGEWAIERADTDLADVVTYNDYSLVLGFHRFAPGVIDNMFEIGYVFARDLEYRSGVGNFEPEESIFFRLSARH
ncbi:hypothetical protein [Thalassoroseus pseudoceratinae]|uniref:hypothetical protein n=1 Tax=Thalassoroseus pseudoceratinae TaxID=2713176 RepID=UPI001421F27D|nr:hypothetical protein [Thalassoroseus pseudoceratinae]